jgi:hypothetical protein
MGGSSHGALSEALEMIGGRVHQGIASSAGVKKFLEFCVIQSAGRTVPA